MRYDRDKALQVLATSLQDHRIQQATLHQDVGAAWVRLALASPTGQTRIVTIGVAGSLNDEAYLIFAEDTPR